MLEEEEEEEEEEEGGLNDAVSVYPPCCVYEPVKKKKKKTGWHIWKQPSFKRAEEEVMLTASNFLTGAETMKEAAPLSPPSTHSPPPLTITRCSFKKNNFLKGR